MPTWSAGTFLRPAGSCQVPLPAISDAATHTPCLSAGSACPKAHLGVADRVAAGTRLHVLAVESLLQGAQLIVLDDLQEERKIYVTACSSVVTLLDAAAQLESELTTQRRALGDARHKRVHSQSRVTLLRAQCMAAHGRPHPAAGLRLHGLRVQRTCSRQNSRYVNSSRMSCRLAFLNCVFCGTDKIGTGQRLKLSGNHETSIMHGAM